MVDRSIGHLAALVRLNRVCDHGRGPSPDRHTQVHAGLSFSWHHGSSRALVRPESHRIVTGGKHGRNSSDPRLDLPVLKCGLNPVRGGEGLLPCGWFPDNRRTLAGFAVPCSLRNYRHELLCQRAQAKGHGGIRGDFIPSRLVWEPFPGRCVIWLDRRRLS